MMYPLLFVVACHVLLAAARSDTIDDVATWRQILKEQAALAEDGQDTRTGWYLPAEGDDVRGGSDAAASAQNSGTGYGNKRGISVISRWKPFRDTMNRFQQRARIFPISPDFEFVSAETRGISRPVGQPLRWGRR